MTSNKSESELHYEYLIKFFNKLIGWALLLSGIAVGIFGVSHSLFKNQIESDLERIEGEVSKLSGKYDSELSRVEKLSEKEIENLKSKLDYEANLAAKLEIERIFRTHNLEILIENVAERKLINKSEEILKQQIDSIFELTKALIKLSTSFERSRWQDVAMKHIYFLDSMAYEHPNEKIRAIASNYLKIKAMDYDRNNNSCNESEREELLKYNTEDSLIKELLGDGSREAIINQRAYPVSKKFRDLRCIRNSNTPGTFDYHELRKLAQ